ncbi:ATP-binding protein [Intrasporangium calvum]|uniref:histidine kinase n=1 Tax=Intrasporangium calvum TaxID=53358 RepID=A0ABT5GJ24_9MICO|nr:HAMP domain-containing sensor histidine kinase [Intrasporangium calvum]MDC5697976.1 ATP-binding protein [Intrasporangium calvum]
MLAQVLVLAASILTAGLVALLVGPSLFHQHLLASGHTDSSPELVHIERAYRDASVVSLGVALIIALACAAAVTWYVTRRLQAPLTALTQAATEISRGHFEARVSEWGSGPELDTLGAAFNLMASQLEQTEDTRRRLLSDLAHEMRTPITTLKLSTEGLRTGVRAWDEHTDRVMTDATERLAQLSADMDDVSRAEEGRLALELDAVPVGDLVWSAGEGQREAYARRGVNLVADAQSAPGATVQVDRRRMGQVLDNLLGNALRHTPSGGSVRLYARQTSNEVEIVVADNGEGITPEQLPHVFERFYRGDSARDRDRSGSGIGLTISRAIVDAHGGGLTASSSGPGRGATFTVALPLRTTSLLKRSATARTET